MTTHKPLGTIQVDVDDLWVDIDDGSKDRTAEVAAGLGATVVTLPANLGYGGAVQTGIQCQLAIARHHGLSFVAVLSQPEAGFLVR